MSLTDLKDCQYDPNLTANEILSQVDITSNTTSYGASIHQNDIEF